MPTDGIDQLRRIVLADPALQALLLAVDEHGPFVAAAVGVANDHGVALSELEVEQALVTARRTWLERWV